LSAPQQGAAESEDDSQRVRLKKFGDANSAMQIHRRKFGDD